MSRTYIVSYTDGALSGEWPVLAENFRVARVLAERTLREYQLWPVAQLDVRLKTSGLMLDEAHAGRVIDPPRTIAKTPGFTRLFETCRRIDLGLFFAQHRENA